MSAVMTVDAANPHVMPPAEAPAAEAAHEAADPPVFAITPAGRLKQIGLSDSDRMCALFAQLSPLGWLVIGPLCILIPVVIWLSRKNDSAFVDDHCRELFSFWISMLLWHFLAAITVLGIVAVPVFWIVMMINMIRGAVAASNGEYFRYPMTVRFFG